MITAGQPYDGLILELVGELVKSRQIKAGGQLGVVHYHAVRRRSHGPGRERGPDGVINDLLHGCPGLVDPLLDQPRHVIVQRQGGTHVIILVPYFIGIKMPGVWDSGAVAAPNQAPVPSMQTIRPTAGPGRLWVPMTYATRRYS